MIRKKIAIALALIVSPLFAQEEYAGLEIGPLTPLYQDSELPYTMDGSWATLKGENNKVIFYETAMAKKPYYYRHTGPFDNPLQKELSPFEWDYCGYNQTWPSGNWIQNIYQHTQDTLIGFVHREDLTKGGHVNPNNKDYFFTGLARSFDGGKHWKYLGDVLGTQANQNEVKGAGNMGGIPVVIRKGYFYIYFNEFSGDQKAYKLGVGVARAKIKEVLQSIRKDTVCAFVKYGQKKWATDPFLGIADCVLPDYGPGYDTHSDAVYCKPIKKYLMTVQDHHGRLLLYQSKDAIRWSKPFILDQEDGFIFPYSSIVSFNDDARDDSIEVGRDFYIYIVRKKKNDYDHDTMFYRKVTIKR